jgi:hypothetical protein
LNQHSLRCARAEIGCSRGIIARELDPVDLSPDKIVVVVRHLDRPYRVVGIGSDRLGGSGDISFNDDLPFNAIFGPKLYEEDTGRI